MLFVPESAAVAAGASGIDGQAQLLDDEGEAALGELGRQVPGIGDHVDRVLAVGVVPAAGAATEDLTHEVGVPLEVLAVDAGVADRLLVGRHVPVDGLGDHTCQNAEQTQDHEGARVRGGREDRSDQGALLGELHLDQRHHALVDVQFRHALGGVREIAQNRRQPLDEEVPVRVVAAVVDRPLRLRTGAGEVEDEPLAARVLRAGLGQGDALRVQLRFVDAVVFGVVLPRVLAHRDLAEDLPPVGLRGGIHHRVEARLDRLDAVALEQFGQAPSPHQAGGALRVEVRRERVGHPRVAGHDAQRRLVGHTAVPQLDRRHHEPLLVHRGRAGRHRPRAAATDVVVVTEGLDEGDDGRLGVAGPGGEDRHRHAEIREVTDATLGEVDVVVEVHVSGVHRLQREVPCDRVDERRVRAARELAQVPVVDSGAEVVCVADHRRPGGPRDRRLDLHLHAGEVAGDDLHEDRIGRCPVQGAQPVRLARLHGSGLGDGSHRFTPFESDVLAMRMFPNASMRARNPGWTGMVELNSSITAGPSSSSPAPSFVRS